MPTKKLVVAEDCAGLAPIIPCLKNLGVILMRNLHTCSTTPYFSTSWHKLRNLGFQAEAFYMSESDPALRQRIRKLYKPQKLSKDCRKYRGILTELLWLRVGFD